MKAAYQVSTNPELANKVGLTVSAIEQWSKKNKVPEKYIFQCISDTGVSIEWLLDEDKPIYSIENLAKKINNQTIETNTGTVSQNGNIYTKDNNDLNINEAALSTFKRAYSRCVDENGDLVEDKLDELIIYLTKFK